MPETVLGAACQRLKFPAFCQRSLRQHLIGRLWKAGVDRKLIAQWQGHQNGGQLILDTYTQVFGSDDEEYVRSQLAKIGGGMVHAAQKKRALVCALKTLPAGGRLLALDETTLRHLPPLRAAWALRGKQAEVRISGKNARRSLFGTVDLRTGRRVVMVPPRQRLVDYQSFLRKLRHGVGACGTLWLLLDRHGSYCHPSSLRLAGHLGIRLFWLPRQHPKLNPVDHLWRALKNTLAANRQFVSVDELADHAAAWVRALTPTQTLRKAGLLSQKCWLRQVRKTLCSPT